MKHFTGVLVALLLGLYLLGPSQVSAAVETQCNTFTANEGYFFDSFESQEYIDGFLVLHFKLKQPYNDGRGWRQNIYLYKSDCTFENFALPFTDMRVRATMQNFSVRFVSDTHYQLWDDELDTPIPCNGCQIDIPATHVNQEPYTSISYNAHIDGNASFLISSSFPIRGQNLPKKNPVVIVPGILGTEFSNGDDKIWPSLPKMITDPRSTFLDSLEMDTLGRPKNLSVKAGQMLKNINYTFGSYEYAGLLLEHLKLSGYTDQEIFTFGYDWRMSAKETSTTLGIKIEEILAQTGASKVDIVAHSLGGLITKYYLINNPEPKVDKVIFVGVPNLGSAKAGKVLIFGDDLGIPLINSLQIQKIAQNMPSIYDLLPSREYFNEIAGYYDDLTDPSIKSILNYSQTKSLLEQRGKNSGLLARSESLHSAEFDNYNLSGKDYSVYNIVGCGNFTLKTIHKMYKGQPTFIQKITRDTKYKIMSDTGDGTVLMKSADSLKTLQGNTFYAIDAEHSKMLSGDGIKQMISGILAGTPATSSSVGSSTVGCAVQGKLLSFSNAAEFSIKDSNNQPVTPGFGVTQTKVGNDTFIFLPTRKNEKYQVSGKPKDSTKPVSAKATTYNNNNSTNAYYDDVNIKTTATFNINVDNSINQQFQVVDEQGNITDIPPSYESDQSIEDIIPPATSIKNYITGALPVDGIFKLTGSSGQIVFSTLDMGAGTYQTTYSFDEGRTWNLAVLDKPLKITDDVQSIIFFSKDKAGNQEEIQVVYFAWEDAVQNNPPTIPPLPDPPSPGPSPDEPELEEEAAEEIIEESVELDQENKEVAPINITIQIPDYNRSGESEPKVKESNDSRTMIIYQPNPYALIFRKLIKLFEISASLIFF